MSTTPKAIKPNRCRHCKARMPDDKARHVLHDDCIDPWLAAERVKKERKQAAKQRAERRVDAVKRETLKSKADWAREAQTAVNAFIRLRDADMPCVSCGRHHQGQYHAGHFLSRGARPELRFVESNIHKQCAPCNVHLSGNSVLFRKALLQKIGVDEVERLEGPNDPCHYTVDDFKAIKTTYAAKARELKKAQS